MRKSIVTISVLLGLLATSRVIVAQQDSYDDYLQKQKQSVAKLHSQWLAANDSKRRAELALELIDAAVRGEEQEVVAEVARDGKPRIIIASNHERERKEILLKPCFTFKQVQWDDNKYDAPTTLPIWRRITPDHLELWNAKQGWLFDGKGRLLNHAIVPRHDGDGREWRGAFLPDGRWVTTDLFESDKTLTGFSKDGKWLWEIQGDKLVPPSKDELALGQLVGLIGWARSDAKGKGWVVSVGSDWGRGVAWVSADGPKNRKQPVDPWKLTFPRALGPRGYYIELSVPSDDGKTLFFKNEAGHGPFVGFPNYSINSAEWKLTIPNGNRHFGFWPDSNEIYIGTDASGNLERQGSMWFFDETGKYRGEIEGLVLGDASNKKDLLVQNSENDVLQINRKLQVTATRRYTWKKGGATARPLEIYEDLGIGFFLLEEGKNKTVVLATWQ